MLLEWKILNKAIMATRRVYGEDKKSNWEIVPNMFEAAKAYCLADAAGSLSKFLPYSFCFGDYGDLEQWRLAFTTDNSPIKVSFKGRSDRLYEAIKDIDFSKPYDAALADSIRLEFTARGAKATVDASEVIEAELFEGE